MVRLRARPSRLHCPRPAPAGARCSGPLLELTRVAGYACAPGRGPRISTENTRRTGSPSHGRKMSLCSKLKTMLPLPESSLVFKRLFGIFESDSCRSKQVLCRGGVGAQHMDTRTPRSSTRYPPPLTFPPTDSHAMSTSWVKSGPLASFPSLGESAMPPGNEKGGSVSLG